MPKVTTSALLPCSPSDLRAYLGATANLPAISDPDLQLEILEAPETIATDAVINFRISAYGFKQKMQHRYISASDSEIVAQQVEGPTRSWTHTQTISPAEGGCTLTDLIEFEPPGGMLGFVMTADKIEESIREGMAFRYEALSELLSP